MAYVKKCDRCGKIYDDNEMPIAYSVCVGDNKVDLCDSCNSGLESFMVLQADDIVPPFGGREYNSNCGAKYSR